MRLQLALSVTSAALAAGNPLAKRAAIDDCLKAANVPVDTKGSTDWNNDIRAFNQRLQYTPVAIAVARTTEHVAAAVSCAAKVGVKVNPKSGGHSYASFGLGGENGHLIVQLDRMSKVTVDSSTKIATVEAGSRLGHVATVLYNNGKRAFSHGTCPGVGVAGHSLHGGFGFSSHTHGLAVDWIVGATVVLANSTVVEASETVNPDIFWALKGSGSNFGIVTHFKFKTFEAPSQVTKFDINLNWGSGQQIASGWQAMQEWVLAGSMPKEMNMRVFGSGSQTQIQGLYHGSSNNLRTAIQPLLSKIGGSLASAQQYDWMGAFSYYTYGNGNVDLTHPYSQTETFYSKSMVTTALSSNTMKAVGDYWINQAKRNSRNWFIIIDFYGGKNSAITKVPTNATSYPYRDQYVWLFELYDRVNSGSYPSNGFSFLDGWVKSFTDNHRGTNDEWGMYINYADPTMSRTEAQNVYFRKNLPKLQQLKAQYDPTELFYYPQAVSPAT
ncbi:hypothetical protein B0T16DRAFT_328146 [Cercophora newfieldiana]|uniref:FAD-binding PCMH-type domain-containing protein n=1 Tax=Cercophora newfieldiana TaxID=92897 RepID=A0AA39Y632_9PEZI|nr:hypothetical protein B0T16DRAFT_328146 [Cercophora newfieldiana]